jgi:hypothetical protein
MNLILQRSSDSGVSTLGKLTVDSLSFVTLEPPFHSPKIYGHTRIPAGTYEILLRTEGAMNLLYKDRYPYIHKGMLWLQNVPDFEDVYLHIGNSVEDTMGCILVGTKIYNTTDCIELSTQAYLRLYQYVVPFIGKGTVEITIVDEIPSNQ